MSWYLLVKLAHILCAIAFVSGLIGRGLVRLRLPRVSSLPVLQELMVLVGQFDEALVVRGSILTLVTGLLAGWAGSWPYIAAGHPTWIFVSLLLFLSTAPLIIFVFIPRGRVFGKALQAAIAEPRITPELRAALADPVVRAATIYESIAVFLIICLMVLKPL